MNQPKHSIPADKADKAWLLLNLLGIQETDLDLLLQICLESGPIPPDPCADTGTTVEPDPLDLLHQVARAYPDQTVQALLRTTWIRLPAGLPRSALSGAAETARLVLRAREALLTLAARCEEAGAPVAQALDRVALNAAPQIHTGLALDDTQEPLFRPLLNYHQRRCSARGPVLSVRAAHSFVGRTRAG